MSQKERNPCVCQIFFVPLRRQRRKQLESDIMNNRDFIAAVVPGKTDTALYPVAYQPAVPYFDARTDEAAGRESAL